MKTRMNKLVSRKPFTSTDVIEKEISGKDPISFIDVIVRMTNGSAMTEASVVKVHDDISKIEIIDGGDVLVSLNMEELQAINAFMNKAMPYQKLTLDDNAVQTEHCRIPLGFFPFDPDHYLKPTDFDNLQIKVYVTMTAAANTAWAATGHDVTIIAGIMEEGYGSYQGFLSSRFARSYAAVDGTEEIVEIPTTQPLNLILIQAFKTATRPDQNIEIIKLDADDGKHIEMELYATELEAQNAVQFGKFMQVLHKRMTNAGDIVLADLYLDTWADCGLGTTLNNTQIISVTAESIVAETTNQT